MTDQIPSASDAAVSDAASSDTADTASSDLTDATGSDGGALTGAIPDAEVSKPAPSPSPPDSTGGVNAIDVLHVEPEPRAAELLATFAERFTSRLSVRTVGQLDEALDAVGGADCVVTEQRLPDGTGVELAERLRERGDRTPIVFYTTCRSEDTEAAASGAGATAYFEKRSARGQHARVLGRVRDLVTGDEDR